MRRISVLITMLLAFPLTAALAMPPITVRSGHEDAVTALSYSPDGGRLFSAGADGKLMVWDVDSGRLLQSIRADQLPIHAMTVYPDGQKVALYSTDGQRNRITVWDWANGERVFLHTPDDEVLTMTVSSRGSYLMYATPSLQSIRVLDGDSGRPLPFLRRDTGIVGWMVIADSEERVMTYTSANGMITYRSIVTGRSVAEFQGPRGLSLPALLQTRRFAAARGQDGTLVVIDLLSGDRVDSVAAGEIDGISIDPSTGDIVVLSTSFGGRRSVRRYRFADGELQQRYATRREFPDNANPVEVAGRGFFAGTPTGDILRWLPFESRPVAFASPALEEITDLHLTGEHLHMLTANRVISIASDFFGAQTGSVTDTSFVRQNMVEIPVGAGARFVPTDDDDVVLWTPENRNGRIQNYRIGDESLRMLGFDVATGLIAVDVYRDELLTLSRSGVLDLRDRRTGEAILEYRGRGLQTAIRTSRGVFIGKAAQGLLDSAVLRVNARTRETVPLESESDLVFFLDFDERRGRLFAIGVRSDNAGEISTVIEVFEGVNLDRRRTILEIPGEYLDAELIHDPVTGTAYTTLDDRGGVLRWDGSRITEMLRNQAHIPRRIYQQGEFLYSLNRDGTVSVVDREDGQPVLDFYVVAGTNGSWVALRPDGRFYASSDRLATEQYLSLNLENTDLASQRIAISGAGIGPQGPEPAAEDGAPMHRFDSAEDPTIDERTDSFDPTSGEPAPSS